MRNTYQIDPAHSRAHFSIRHLMISNVRGDFSNVTGTVVWDPENPSATSIDARIDATTLNTRDEKRDGHVKSPDFLDVAQFPEITFRSTKAEAAGEGHLKVTGDLTIHGVTKETVLDVETGGEGGDMYGNTRLGASAVTKLKRADFGVQWNAPLDTGGVVLGEELKIELDIQMVKSAAATA